MLPSHVGGIRIGSSTSEYLKRGCNNGLRESLVGEANRIQPFPFRCQRERPLSTEPIDRAEDPIPCEIRVLEDDVTERIPR